jgi:hypothetical protein
MDAVALPELYEVAARAGTSRRYAPVYLHDFRGSMQALFSAVELLGRAAKAGGGDQERIERAYHLARRALNNHEQFTLATLQNLLLMHVDAVPLELAALATDAVHFLRGEAVDKGVSLRLLAAVEVQIVADRAKLQSLLVGLMAAAVDDAPPGSELPVRVERCGNDAVLSIGSHAGYAPMPKPEDLSERPTSLLTPGELTLLFAWRFLAANGGRLEIDARAAPRGLLRVLYPSAD